jgi:hypothetical protein
MGGQHSRQSISGEMQKMTRIDHKRAANYNMASTKVPLR